MERGINWLNDDLDVGQTNAKRCCLTIKWAVGDHPVSAGSLQKKTPQTTADRCSHMRCPSSIAQNHQITDSSGWWSKLHATDKEPLNWLWKCPAAASMRTGRESDSGAPIHSTSSLKKSGLSLFRTCSRKYCYKCGNKSNNSQQTAHLRTGGNKWVQRDGGSCSGLMCQNLKYLALREGRLFTGGLERIMEVRTQGMLSFQLSSALVILPHNMSTSVPDSFYNWIKLVCGQVGLLWIPLSSVLSFIHKQIHVLYIVMCTCADEGQKQRSFVHNSWMRDFLCTVSEDRWCCWLVTGFWLLLYIISQCYCSFVLLIWQTGTKTHNKWTLGCRQQFCVWQQKPCLCDANETWCSLDRLNTVVSGLS